MAVAAMATEVVDRNFEMKPNPGAWFITQARHPLFCGSGDFA